MAAHSEEPGFPALDFAPVGYRTWTGDRRLSAVHGEPGQPVWDIALAHSATDAFVLVVTAPRRRWDEIMAPAGLGAVEFAESLLMPLVDAARPELSEADRRRYNSGLQSYPRSRAQAWNDWEQARWQLEGSSLDARIARFAHAWVGMSAGDAERYIGVLAYGKVDVEVELDVVDGAAYRFDFRHPFDLRAIEAAAAGPPSTEHIVRSQEMHPDHAEVTAAASSEIR